MSFRSAKAALDGTRFADLRWVTETGSTNADLVAAAVTGTGECALVADHQRAGRGRLDRRWEAPPGASLLMSVLVRPPFPVAGSNLLGTALGLAACDAVSGLGGIEVSMKWPNDVVAPGVGAGGEDLKLGGLLAELTGTPEHPAVVVGIGLNVAWRGVEFPDELAATATAVDLLGGRIDRADLAVELLRSMDSVGELATPRGCAALMRRYRDACVTISSRVRIEMPSGVLVGTAHDVNDDGSLLVRTDDGVDHLVTVGDVVHVRPRPD